MKIALVIQKLAGLRGGAERVVIDLARAMAVRGHEVSLVTYEPSAGDPAYETGGVPLVDLFPGVIRAGLRVSSDVRMADSGRGVEHALSDRRVSGPSATLRWQVTHGLFARSLARWLARNRHDVVAGFLPPAISAVAFAGRRLGAERPRLIASTHNLPELDFGDSPRWDQNPVARQRNLWALCAVDTVTVLQEEFVAQLPPQAREHAVVLPNAVSPPSTRRDVEREPLVLGVGRLTDVKRYQLLIGAFARLADDHPDWRLVIYGDGPEREKLERLVADNGLAGRATLPGSTPDITDQYVRARVLCHPAEYEGFGLSVAEALVHGMFVVASKDCVGVNALVEHGVSGLLVDEGRDPEGAMAQALRTTMAWANENESARGAVERLRERFDPEVIYDRWERVLRA